MYQQSSVPTVRYLTSYIEELYDNTLIRQTLKNVRVDRLVKFNDGHDAVNT